MTAGTTETPWIEPKAAERTVSNGSLNVEDIASAGLSTRPQRNLAVVSISFLLLFTAFFGVQNLASSLDKRQASGAPSKLEQQNVSGAVSIGIIYAFFVLSCLSAPAVVHRVGTKAAIVGSAACYFPYVAAFLFPRPYTLYPAAVLLGVVAGPLWVGQASYCTWLAKSQAAAAGLPLAACNGVIQGTFYFALRSCQVIGNLMSSVVEAAFSTEVLFVAYSVCIVVAVLLMAVCADSVPSGVAVDAAPRPLRQTLQLTAKVFFTRKMLMLWPTMLLVGVEQAFSFGALTASLLQPALGSSNIGYVMACYGAANAMSSAFGGKTSDRIGKRPVLLFACLIFVLLGVLGVCSQMQGTLEDDIVFSPLNSWPALVLYACGFGLGDGMLNTVIVSAMGCPQVLNSKESEAGFANVQLWTALVMSFFFFAPSSSALVKPKLACLIAVATAAAVGLIVSPELTLADTTTRAQRRSAADNNGQAHPLAVAA